MSIELFQQRDELCRKLSESVRLMQKYGIEQAEAQCAYNEELAKTAVRLKDDGMSATLINTVIHGTGQVPKLRMKRDVSDVMFSTARENINSIKLQLKVVQSQIDQEWGMAKREL